MVHLERRRVCWIDDRSGATSTRGEIYHSRRFDSEHHYDLETSTTRMKDTVETSMTTSALLRTLYLAEVVGRWSEIISPAMCFIEAVATSIVLQPPSSNYCTTTPPEPSMQRNSQPGETADSSSLASLQSTPTTHQSFVHSTPNEPSLQDQLSIKEEINNYVGQRTDAVSECETNAPEESEAAGFADREPAQTPRIKISTYPKRFQTLFRDADTFHCCRHFAHRDELHSR